MLFERSALHQTTFKASFVNAPTSSVSPVQMTWANQQATQHAAQALAQVASIGQALIELHGGLGAGKTTFVRYLLQALGVTGHIKSPTYAIAESYETAAFPVWHFDFYRFNDPLEWEDAGFRDIFATQGLKLVEWPEQAEGLMPTPDLKLFITSDPLQQQRLVQLHTMTALGQSILQSWMQNLQQTRNT